MLESSKSITTAHFDLPILPGKVGWREACVTAAARCRIELVAIDLVAIDLVAEE
jgi:hypothetical protein